ncbi:MAG: RNA 2',3'-cyclic phosphodiesterase [Candidatus Jettenia sp.]|uniref:RNA 2',3'-cyclic phosphodiesterase n=1 Tax=Candidatus Jettenia caeni TaxID=247490 RepID=I3IHG6_9BACT|nr:RNA 2',3'-cyclic phosphodiesterase [Candidatus Jettenia sp. AMX1]MBC6929875.1 RNA 2',3'-cyclic phosphodiesterase [Candidatus Jettenia sp.]WKZ16491.1 MAG: RNA 2',3'-cyclic phosphodiesterase [Candidatus Jettenia caeni]MDL1939955.1 RNA 2',3'-cyclic phosphodiesterase [Candidatus Jettenia sp. AMX1]GAB61161.1 2'-5' RNA ligase [Candidatus Jettenia caeni]GIL21399.1 MAG: RNA 2',3'-cyclic phosphodiesterase [Candidatus Jettenia caeni]
MKVRLFVAVEIPEEIRKKLGEFQDELKKANADVGWVAPENLHITLKFIGSLDEEKIDEVVRIIKDSAAGTKLFDLNYMGVGAFPTEKNPRIVYADVIDSDGILTKIHEKLNNQLVALGVKHEDRKFEAHLTVGRIKTRKNVKRLMEILNSYNGFHFGLAQVTRIVLMKSDLLQKGPIYTKLHTIDLVSL